MTITFTQDTGSRYEWACVFTDVKYIVSYHYLDETWSVQLVRPDGEKQIVSRSEMRALMRYFPKDDALDLATSLRPTPPSDPDVTPSPDRPVPD